MPAAISGLISAWPQVARRSITHWRLLSSVVVGVLLASAIMAGTVIYFDSLRELALENTLSRLSVTEADIVVKAERGPTSYQEYEKVAASIGAEVDRRLDWFLRDRIRGGKTSTFFLTAPGSEELAGRDDARTYFAFLPRLEGHITVTAGESPRDEALNAPGEIPTLEALVPAEAAELLDVGVGDTLSAVPYWDDTSPYARVVISGVFSRTDPTDEFWHLDDTLFQVSRSGHLRSLPFYISETSYMEVLADAFQNMDSTYGWLLAVEPSMLNAENASDARFNIQAMAIKQGSDLFRYRQITSLDRALVDYDVRLFFSKVPMFIVLVLIAVVILYYVVTLSSLLVDQQRGEIALLRSRGASSAQILAVFVLEGATIAGLAIAVAPLLALAVISLLGYTPAFSGLGDGGRLPVSLSGGAYAMSAVGGVLSFAALMVPAVHASRIGVAGHRQQSARPSGQPFFQRYYFDVILLVVSIILFRQLSEQGSVVAVGVFGRVAVDQVLLAVPALVLVALAMVLFRLYPLAIRFVSGDSAALLDVVIAATVLILAPSIAVRETVEGSGLIWLAQVSSLAALAAVYWATSRTGSTPLRVLGLVTQGGLVGVVLSQGPPLPLEQVFMPLLIAIVPAQVAYMLVVAFAQRAPVAFSVGMWQMARNPTHYARLSLLLILMAGLGIFAASFGGTLRLSFEQRALYSTGSDIRLEGLILNSTGRSRPVAESYETMAGVDRATPAFRGLGTDLSKLLGETYTMFAADQSSLAEIAWFRDDFADRPLEELLPGLVSTTIPQGISLPESARTLGVVLKADRPHPSIAVTARVKDANGRYFTYFLGSLTSADWVSMDARLSRVRGPGFTSRLLPVPPLDLASISFHEVNALIRLAAGAAIIDQIHVGTNAGEIKVIESFDDTAAWNVLRAVPQSKSDGLEQSGVTMNGGGGSARFVWADGGPLLSRGIYYGPLLEPLAVLASRTFLKETGHSLGDEFQASVKGHRVQVRLAHAIDYFPSLDTVNESFLVADLPSLSSYTNLETTSSEVRPNEIWLSTETNGADRERLVQRLTDNEPFTSRVVHDRAEELAASQVDPLVEAGWRALLFMAFSAVLILSAIGFLVHAYVSFRDREAQFALMRTIGFSTRQLITLVWLEQVLVIGAGLALGTWMGRELGSSIMPFLSHNDRGGHVLPPFTVEISWGTLLITYVAMAMAFALIIAGVIWFIRRISLQRILRLGEM